MEHSKDKAKQCLDDAQRLSGVTNPNDITSEKQAVYNYAIYIIEFIFCCFINSSNSNMIVIQMIWEKLMKEFMSIKQGLSCATV